MYKINIKYPTTIKIIKHKFNCEIFKNNKTIKATSNLLTQKDLNILANTRRYNNRECKKITIDRVNKALLQLATNQSNFYEKLDYTNKDQFLKTRNVLKILF